MVADLAGEAACLLAEGVNQEGEVVHPQAAGVRPPVVTASPLAEVAGHLVGEADQEVRGEGSVALVQTHRLVAGRLAWGSRRRCQQVPRLAQDLRAWVFRHLWRVNE